MKLLAQLLLGMAVLGAPAHSLAQPTDEGAPPAATDSKFSRRRSCCGVFNKRRLTVALGDKRELNFPNAISGFSRNSSVVRASLEFGTLTIQAVALGKTQVVVLGNRQEKQTILVQVVRPGSANADSAAARHEKKPPVSTAAKSSQAVVKPDSQSRVSRGIAPADSGSGEVAPEEHAGPPVTSDLPKSAARARLAPSETGISNPGELNGYGKDINRTTAAPPGDSVKLVELTAIAVTLASDQVRAAYSLDPLVAEAEIDGNHVRIWGRSPGEAMVVLVNKDFSTTTLQVAVMQAPPILPDGVWSGLNPAEAQGFYEGRVSSDPMEVRQIFDYHAGRMRLHISNAVLAGGSLPGVSTTWFPFSLFRFSAERWKLTLVDERVNSSPISVNATVLRGVHFATGGFSTHVGYTSVAGFESLFLPVHKQLIAGAVFAQPLGGDYEFGMTGYYIQHDVFALDPHTGSTVGTLFFRKQSLIGRSRTGGLQTSSSPASTFAAEVGFSGGIAGAVSAERDTSGDQFQMAARYRPRQYAMADVDNLAGLQSDGRWNHYWSQRFASDISGSDNHLFTRLGAQSVEVATADLRFKPAKEVVLSSGISVSSFSDRQALFPDVHRYSIPLTFSYDRHRFGIGAQYEYSQTSRAFSPGHAYRGSARWNGTHFQINANAGLDTQALGVDSVFSAFPGLNAQLASLGFGTSTSVEQLAALLSERAFLNALGVAPGATLELVPRDWHAGVNLSWRSALQALDFDSNYNLNSFLIQKNTTALQTARYRRRITNSTEGFASFTMFETFEPLRRTTPIWEVGLRHQFGGGRFLHFHQHSGTITGIVRLQDSSGTKPVQGVAIMLDGDRKVTSDSEGHYQFSRVQAGIHSVQVTFKSARPFFYTTPSKVSTATDSVVDFGVIYASAQVVGYALNDAGVGLPEIGILVKGPQSELTLTTNKAGEFVLPVARPGDYVVSVKTETVPDGYALEDLLPAELFVQDGEFKKVSFKLPAIRALTGEVERYDVARKEYVPVKNAAVMLAELNRRTITDAKGWYSFRNIPAGTFTIQVNQQPFGQVSFGSGPQLLRQDIQLRPQAITMTP